MSEVFYSHIGGGGEERESKIILRCKTTLFTSIGSTSMYRQMNHLVEKIVYDTPSFSICSNKAGSFTLNFSQEVKKI